MNNVEKLEKARRTTWGKINPASLQEVVASGGRRILDVGCGCGDYVHWLADNGYEAYGLDILKWAEWEKSPMVNHFTNGSIYQLPYGDASFETVIAFEILEHLDDLDRALDEIRRVTSKNLILSVPNCKMEPAYEFAKFVPYHWIDRTHINLFTIESIQETLRRKNFKIKTARLINQIHPELLVFDAYHVPRLFSRAWRKLILPLVFFRSRFYSQILVVAEK